MRRFFARALRHQADADPHFIRHDRFAFTGIACEQPQERLVRRIALIDGAVLGVDERRQLRQQQITDCRQVSLTLHHARKLRQVGLEPVLLGVLIRRRPQGPDHHVDVVLQLGHFSARLHLN